MYHFVMVGGREAQMHINTFQNGFKDIAKLWNIPKVKQQSWESFLRAIWKCVRVRKYE